MDAFGAVDLTGGAAVASPMSDGHWISDKVSRIVEVINDYDPMIEVEWISADKRLPTDPAFRLVEKTADGRKFIMFYVNTEAEFDESVLARIFNSDAMKNPLSLAAIDAKNAAVKLIKAKEQMDELEEAHDLASHIYKSPKARYRHNGVVYE